MISFNKKSLKKVCKVIAVSSISLIIIMFVITKVIYDSAFARYDTVISVSSELNGLVESRNEHTVMCGENRLCGYLYNADSDKLIIVSPGFNASADSYLWQIKSLNDNGFAVFAFDSTGNCNSTGKSCIGFSQEILDLKAVIEYIEKMKKFGYNELMLFGHSRGGYASCSVLNDYDVSAVVSISGVNSCMEAVIEPVAQKIGFAAYGNYPMLWLYQSMLFGSDVVNTEAHKEIQQAQAKVLVVQGADDLNSYGKYSIYSYKDDIKSDNVSFYLCKDKGHSGHTDLLFDDNGRENKELMSVIIKFFEEV